MIDYLSIVMENLSSLNINELNKVIDIAKKKKEKMVADEKCAAAANLVKAFNAYKEATGEEEVMIQNCFGRDFGTIDAYITIDKLYLDGNGNICHKVTY